jgi:hypothetical protein
MFLWVIFDRRGAPTPKAGLLWRADGPRSLKPLARSTASAWKLTSAAISHAATQNWPADAMSLLADLLRVPLDDQATLRSIFAELAAPVPP